MVNKQVLDIVVCPVSHQPLRIIDKTLLARINEAIAAGRVKNQAGRPVTEEIREGLIRQDEQIFYPIRDGIPVLLADEGIAVKSGE